MATRNTNQGRHLAGSPIAKSGIRPPSRTGSASGYFVGTGVNRKTAATPQHKASPSAASTNYTRQAQQFVRQSPEPFRNPTRAANPMGTVPSDRRPGMTNPLGVRVMSQSEMNTATGHAASYKPKGYHAATSGFPTQGVRRAGSSHDAFKSGWQSNKPTGGAKLMKGLTTVGGFSDRGLVQGPGIPVRLLPSRARKGSIPQG